MKRTIIFIIFFLSNFVFSQLNSDKLKLIKELNQLEYAESENVGFAGGLGDSRIKFDSIKKNFTNNDLVELAKSFSPALRLYSCIELIHRNDTRIIDIFRLYQESNYRIQFNSGCNSQTQQKLSELIFQEFETLVKKKAILKKTEEQLARNEISEVNVKTSEEFVKFGKQYLNKVMTKKFYRIYDKLKKIRKT